MVLGLVLAAVGGLWNRSARAAIPELNEAQRVQLDTAEDGYLPDEPAWTGLLTSVATWDPVEAAAGDVPGATVPDYDHLLVEPEAYRGDLFVIKGFYAGRQRRLLTARTGPWGDALVEWGVEVRSNTIVMVYLVSPDAEVVPPREGQTVRLAARFYKLWTDVDAEGVERTYPVFVGRSAMVVEGPSGSSGVGAMVVGAVVVLAGLLGVVMVMRRRAVGRGATRREAIRRRLREEAQDYDEQGEGNDQTLPRDPAEALEQLGRQDRGV